MSSKVDERSPGEITSLLAEVKCGHSDAFARLMPLVYRELRRLAGRYMRGERPDHTLQPTALVNEVYLRMVGQERADWHDRAHFMGVAAQLMRRILVDHARKHSAVKRSAALVSLDEVEPGQFDTVRQADEILAVDRALEHLSLLDPQQSRIVELRYFGGLSVEEVAEAMGISARTVKRDWAMAKAWLRSQLAAKASV